MFRKLFSRRTNRPDPNVLPLDGAVRTMPSAHGFSADVPVGPPCPPSLNPGTALETALQAGIVDAKAGIHDAISLRHEASLIYHLDIDQQISRATADAVLGRHDAEQSASWLLVQKNAIAEELPKRLEQVTDRLGAARLRMERCRAELMGEGEYADSTWKDPTRVEEPPRTTWLKSWLPPALLALAEVGVTALALQTLGGGMVELVCFALVLGAATVTAGHMAGTHIRVHAGDSWQRRWLIPAVLAVLVVGIVLFVASLRVAFVDAPQIDPTTGSIQGSMLSQAGVASWVIWTGLSGLQLVFFAATALHAASVHNPLVRAMQRVVAEVGVLEGQRAELVRQEAAARESAVMAREDKARVPGQWESYAAGLAHLAEQMKTTYAIGYTRQAADPEVTVAMEARLAGLGRTAPTGISGEEAVPNPAPAGPLEGVFAGLQPPRSESGPEEAVHPNGVRPPTRLGG